MRYLIIILVVILLLPQMSCFKEDDYKVVDAPKVLTLSGDTSAILLANGLAAAGVRVKLSDDAAPDKRTVIFKTSSGSFVSGAGDSIIVTAGNDLIARASLVSTKEGAAIVSAKILNVNAKDSLTINFKKAFPEKITVSVDSFVIYNNYSSTILITASVGTNDGGKASQGTKIYFSVTNAAGAVVGLFLNNQSIASSGSDGKATIRYSAGPNNQPGFLTIKDSTAKEDQSYISATTRIYLSN